jgi:LysM domain
MSALSAIEAPEFGDEAMPGPGVASTNVPPGSAQRLVLVTGPARPGRVRPAGPSAGAGPKAASRDAQVLPAPGRRTAAGARGAPLRLTRRGRIVVTAVAIFLATVVITVIGMAAPGGAQAANHGRPGAGYGGMHQVVVRPGQTLWSIAASAEPTADPRLVISQIMTANSMTSDVVEAGELLWVPK